MSIKYPVTFSLEDGTQVEVTAAAENTYNFKLTPEDGSQSHFTFVEEIPRDKNIDSLDFDQLNALRRFWLEQEEQS